MTKIDEDLVNVLDDVYTTLAENQEPLGEECQKVLNERRWDLYEE